MCMIDGADIGNRFYVSRLRKAKKEHRCGECERIIQPGERYEVATGKNDDGYLWRAKTCAQCCAARRWLEVVCNGFCHFGVYQDLREHFAEGYNPRWLAIATSGMRKRWRGKDGKLRRPMSLPKNLPIDEVA